MSDVVIKAENLSKYYKLGVINNGTLFRDIQTWWALKCGKEDPHSRLGEHKYDTTKDGFWALKNLNFEIKQGDRVGIIGKNGAGKSTLLKVLSRITAPTEGNVKIKGRIASLLEVGTGFHAELTGRENIYLNGAILGMKRAEVTQKLDEIIAFSGIGEHIDTPVKRYSSGMYVRLAFAVAAHLDSEILIADEVLAVGDAEFQKKALGKMNELSSGQGRTVLFVSHNMSQIKALCNKGIVLEKGSIACLGSMKDATDFYLNKNKLQDAKVIDFKLEKNPFFHINKVLVNGKEKSLVNIPLNKDCIELKFEGTSENAQQVDVMLILKNADGVPIATFAPGHFEGKVMEVKGNFKINTTIKLPKYYAKSNLVASICLHQPGVEGLVDFEDAVYFSFDGRSDKNVIDMPRNGFLGLEGNNKNSKLVKNN